MSPSVPTAASWRWATLAGAVTLWDVARRSKVRDLSGPVAAYAVRFSPDGKLVAVGDSSGTVALWDASTGRRVGQPLVGNDGGVDSMDFNRSGTTLMSTSGEGKLLLWDLASRKLIGAPLPGSNTDGYARFFPDGKHVLGVFDSGAAIVWNVDPAAWRARACRVAGRNLTRAEWAAFLGHRSYRSVCP
jgi:WD40 repeat protein